MPSLHRNNSLHYLNFPSKINRLTVMHQDFLNRLVCLRTATTYSRRLRRGVSSSPSGLIHPGASLTLPTDRKEKAWGNVCRQISPTGPGTPKGGKPFIPGERTMNLSLENSKRTFFKIKIWEKGNCLIMKRSVRNLKDGYP